jgi:p-aminobenzoyl-glutamate transporter AbgT
VSDHPINMQRQHMEWEVSCHPLWGMAHKLARVGDVSQHQTISSTHPLLISITHSL